MSLLCNCTNIQVDIYNNYSHRSRTTIHFLMLAYCERQTSVCARACVCLVNFINFDWIRFPLATFRDAFFTLLIQILSFLLSRFLFRHNLISLFLAEYSFMIKTHSSLSLSVFILLLFYIMASGSPPDFPMCVLRHLRFVLEYVLFLSFFSRSIFTIERALIKLKLDTPDF